VLICEISKKYNIIKQLTKKDGFKIYFWPIFFCFIFVYPWMFLFFLTKKENTYFLGLQPGSLREAIFVAGYGAVLVLYLWMITFRYKKIKEKSVNKRTKIMLTIITIAFCLFPIRLFLF